MVTPVEMRERFERMCADAKGTLADVLGMTPKRSDQRPTGFRCQCGGGCESDLECTFWYYLRKTNQGERRAFRQVEIGAYRVDCLADHDSELIVVELDGKEFHDAHADYLRDNDLLLTVDAVVHIPYAAMHFYSRATMSVLGAWWGRFKLRADDQFVLHTSELASEMESTIDSEGDIPNRKAFIDWADPNFELWNAMDGIGWVGSVRAHLERWNVTPIICRRASERHRAEWKLGLKSLPAREIKP